MKNQHDTIVCPSGKESPHALLRGTRIGDVKWTAGFWKHRFDTCRKNMVPAMWEILADDDLSHAFANFRIAAGDEEGEHRGPPFFDGDLYKWLEAAVSVCAVEPEQGLRELIDSVVPVIARSQREDGYIHTPVVVESRQRNDSSGELRDHLNFEMYNFGHLFTTACLHRVVTGDSALFDTAVRACAYLEKTFGTPTPELARHSICPSHFMGLADMFRATGDERFLRLLDKLFNMRDLREGGQDQNQDRIPFRAQRKAVGHAVRANYLYAGAADLYAETGEKAIMDVLEAVWENLTTEKMYITGACGAVYDGASPDGSEHHDSVQLIHQAYGREYQLPNGTAYNETCANIGNLLWNWRMLRITGESRYADLLEHTLFNGILCGISLDGTRYFYVNALERLKELPFPLRWSRKRERYITSFCCPPNTVRTIAQSSNYAYALSDHAVWTVLYGACDATLEVPNAGTMSIRQQTEYPWQGSVSLIVDSAPDVEITLNLRIPAWTECAEIRINDIPSPESVEAGTFFKVRRKWNHGDHVSLVLSMPVRLMETHPLVEEDRNQVAVMRGPVVYCIESADLPGGVSVRDLFVRPETQFTPVKGDGLLHGMTLIEFSADLGSSGNWNGELYRPLKSRKFRLLRTRLVPYFAWDNRGDGEMAIWLKLRS